MYHRHAAALAAMFLFVGCAPGNVTDITATPTDSDVAARFFHKASPLGDDIVMVTGGLGLQIVPPSLISRDEISFYDVPSGTFSDSFAPTNGDPVVTPLLITPRSSHTQTLLDDGRVLITGGRTGATGQNPGTPIASVEIFDPVTGVVASGPDMAATRAAHTATLLSDGRVVVAGGASWQVFDPGTDSWSPNHDLDFARVSAAAVLMPDGDVMLVGGGGDGGGATLEFLDPDTGNTHVSASTMAVAVDDVAAAILPTGDVLIVGGQSLATGNTIADSYRYQIDIDQLQSVTAPAAFPNGVADHHLVVLGGIALAFGGEAQVEGDDTELDTFAVYDIASDDWTASGSMAFVHDDFASAVLADGRVLAVGGGVPFLDLVAPSATSELLTPVTGDAADINCDGAVDVADLLVLLAAWGPCPPVCPGDLDGSGAVDVGDLLIVLAAWS